MNDTPSGPKQQTVEQIKQAKHILLTVPRDPSVDELSAAVGLTLLLDKLEKRPTTVFSGKIPPAMSFLEPRKVITESVDGLRDFIVALDKNKADKLRWKVEDDVVKIYITPYKTQLSQKDLEFSQGEFNVELVIALGVEKNDDLDKAISSHGRILHDATVITVNAGNKKSDVGSIDWQETTASSICEMLVSITESFGSGLLDDQIATAFLTGIVANTNRFSNELTTPRVMTMSAQLMAAGANQQLIATHLGAPQELGENDEADIKDAIEIPSDKEAGKKSEAKSDDESDSTEINLEHDEDSGKDSKNEQPKPKKVDEAASESDDNPAKAPEHETKPEEPVEEPAETELNKQKSEPARDEDSKISISPHKAKMEIPPTYGGTLNAAALPDHEPTVEELAGGAEGPTLNHAQAGVTPEVGEQSAGPVLPGPTESNTEEPLAESNASEPIAPEVTEQVPIQPPVVDSSVDEARRAVDDAVSTQSVVPPVVEPVQSAEPIAPAAAIQSEPIANNSWQDNLSNSSLNQTPNNDDNLMQSVLPSSSPVSESPATSTGTGDLYMPPELPPLPSEPSSDQSTSLPPLPPLPNYTPAPSDIPAAQLPTIDTPTIGQIDSIPPAGLNEQPTQPETITPPPVNDDPGTFPLPPAQ